MSSGVKSTGQSASPAVEGRVDWQTAFDEWDSGEYIPRDNLWRHLVIKLGVVAGKPEAEEAIKNAEEAGRITQTKKGYRLNSNGDTQSDTSNAHAQSSQVHPAVQELRDEAEDKDEYIERMESALTDVLDRMDDLESRVEEVEDTDDNREERVNKIFDGYREIRPAVTELQLRHLQQGEIMSANGVDVDALKEMGFDPIRIGENNDMIRLPSEDQEDGSESTESPDLPDFDALCKLEALRVKKLCGIVSRQDIEGQDKGKDKFRALAVFADAGLLDTSDKADKISIPSSKVGEKIQKIAPDGEISEDSIYQIRRRVMRRMTEETDENWTDGVFRWNDDEKENKIVADAADLRDAKVQRFRNMQLDLGGGDSNVVVR